MAININEIESIIEKRRQEILNAPDTIVITGTKYYVSNSGDDSNDGLSPDKPWKTLARVSDAELNEGDAVLFCRGDLFRGEVVAKAGVTYAAYGEGEKPKLYACDRNMADPSLWVLTDREHNIWRYTEKTLDAGTLVFNEGEKHSVKLIPSYINGRFVCRNDESKLFDMAEEMVRDLDVFWYFDEILTERPSKDESFPIPDMTPKSYGDLYLRCDKGNPGEVFESIEATSRRKIIAVGKNPNVRVDNLCLKYAGIHAVQGGSACLEGLKVTNCEIGWTGGTIQHYFGTDPNYPQGRRGTVTRFGNGVEIYGGCNNYEVSDCYIYQAYDAGATHQVSTGGNKRTMTNIAYKRNLIDYCVYSIEYFLEMNGEDTESYMEGIEISDNILCRSGYGWGQQRHNTDTPAHIKGWSYENKASNFTISNNIFYKAAYRMVHLVAKEQSSCPTMKNNTYIQHQGGMLGQYGSNLEKEPEILIFGENAKDTITQVFNESEPEVHILK